MKNVLIVDDEKFVRLGLRTMIQRSGFCTGTIMESKNGVEAIEELKNHTFDVVFSDIKMPIMDGIAMIQKIKEEELSKAVLVIISGYDDFSFAVKALRNGVSDYLLKPVERDVFQKLLEKIERELEEKNLEGVKLIEVEEAYGDKGQKIQKAIAFIQSHYNEDINMAVVSNEVSMNYTFFSETFKEQTGKSFVEYLKSVRIHMAKKLLRESCMQIARVAFEVGFKDDKHFSKTFKIETGMTPTEYKKKNAEKNDVHSESEEESNEK